MKMSDYLIDFQTAIEAMRHISDCICEAQAVDALCELPTIELIRCKDCKYRITANCERFGIKRYTQSDSFCSWAEPKEADG